MFGNKRGGGGGNGGGDGRASPQIDFVKFRWRHRSFDRFGCRRLAGLGFLYCRCLAAWSCAAVRQLQADSEPGLRWRMPYPIQSHELVNLTGVRTIEIGYRGSERNKVLKEALMLTDDENIVNIPVCGSVHPKGSSRLSFQQPSYR